MRLSFWANVVLLVLKVFIAVQSGSLSIVVSALDSVLDVVSGFILYLTSEAVRRRNKYRFPIGKVSFERFRSFPRFREGRLVSVSRSSRGRVWFRFRKGAVRST